MLNKATIILLSCAISTLLAAKNSPLPGTCETLPSTVHIVKGSYNKRIEKK